MDMLGIKSSKMAYKAISAKVSSTQKVRLLSIDYLWQ